MHYLLENSDRFKTHVSDILDRNIPAIGEGDTLLADTSSVLFLMSEAFTKTGGPKRPCLILTKRSREVRQPGDLCFPGGGAAPRFDAAFAKLLALPGFPLANWRKRLRSTQSNNHHRLSQCLATSLRESFEEMGLIPMGVRFLGPLPPQRLVLYNRVIYPMVGWVKHQRFFRVNGEVEKLVRIPIDALLESDNYAFFQMTYPLDLPKAMDTSRQEFPCFLHHQQGRTEVLWGATYRIVETFLSQAFDFSPPATSDLPRVENRLALNYFTNR